MSTDSSMLKTPAFDTFGNDELAAMEGITGPPADHLIRLSGILDTAAAAQQPSTELAVLENAAGAGILSAKLKAQLPEGAKVKVVAGDVERTMVDLATKRFEAAGLGDVRAQVIDGMVRLVSLSLLCLYSSPLPLTRDSPPRSAALERPSRSATSRSTTRSSTLASSCILTRPRASLVRPAAPCAAPSLTRTDLVLLLAPLPLSPFPLSPPAESLRILRPGGTLALTTWHTPGFLPLLQRADPSFPIPPPMQHPLALRGSAASILIDAGCAPGSVRTEDVRVRVPFDGAEAFFELMRKGMKGLIADEERNVRIRGAIEEMYGEGPFVLEWEGLAVVGRKA